MDKQDIHYGAIKELLQAYFATNAHSKVFILVDENTKAACLPLLELEQATIIEIASGEQHKNLQTTQQIWTKLFEHEANRNALLINLGGGVIGDMGGFCAASFKRGIHFVQVPTTLLAMIDASIGGKTGIDFYNQKNMLGFFKNADAVLIDNKFLKSLSERELNSGKAEMLKHGIIANKKHLFEIPVNSIPTLDLIKESIAIKRAIVKQDPYEKGLRKALNFGHTLGHGLESYCISENIDLLHGEAVAQGMLWAIQLSEKFAGLNQEDAVAITKEIKRHFKTLDVTNKTLQTVVEIAKNDKKNTDDNIAFCLLGALEKPIIDIKLKPEAILACLSN